MHSGKGTHVGHAMGESAATAKLAKRTQGGREDSRQVQVWFRLKYDGCCIIISSLLYSRTHHQAHLLAEKAKREK